MKTFSIQKKIHDEIITHNNNIKRLVGLLDFETFISSMLNEDIKGILEVNFSFYSNTITIRLRSDGKVSDAFKLLEKYDIDVSEFARTYQDSYEIEGKAVINGVVIRIYINTVCSSYCKMVEDRTKEPTIHIVYPSTLKCEE